MKVAGFFSDPHFGHKNIIEFCSRPFESVYDMELQMIRRYNAKVGPTDLMYWVGDNFFYKSVYEAAGLLEYFNGYKILIMGNHDKRHGKNFMARAGFDAVIEKEAFISIGSRVCRICHYPYAHPGQKDHRRPIRVKGEVLIHGHTHSTEKRNGNMIHVGVDAWDYGPAMIEDVAKLVAEV